MSLNNINLLKGNVLFSLLYSQVCFHIGMHAYMCTCRSLELRAVTYSKKYKLFNIVMHCSFVIENNPVGELCQERVFLTVNVTSTSVC